MAIPFPEVLTVRLSRALLAKVDGVAEDLRRASPRASLGRADAVFTTRLRVRRPTGRAHAVPQDQRLAPLALIRVGRHRTRGGYDGARENNTGPRRARRSFTDEFKAGAVRLVLEEGKSVLSVARELDLTASALGDWVAKARADRTKGKTGLTTEERVELSRLRKENRELRVERDIPKKAAVSSIGQRNTWYGPRHGATGTSGLVGEAEEGPLVEVAPRAVAQRDRAGSGEASRLDLRGPCREWRNHSPDEDAKRRCSLASRA